jgi:MoaA/NifB/PqqE/SkfB family radical SAM enzyme
MSLELYHRLLEELGDYLFQVEFANWGEPLLNKQLNTMFRAAADRGISTLTTTNFSVPFDAERAERLVASGLNVLGVSIDGARQETYEQYRVRGDFARVVENCRLVRDAKRRLGSKTPRMTWIFHVFPHNVDDVDTARAMAAELEMTVSIEKGWVVGQEWDPGGKWSFILGEPQPDSCYFLWYAAVINNDGGVAPCCGSFYREDDMGQISLAPNGSGASSFREIWNGQQFREARRLYRSRTGSADTRASICFDCPSTIIWENWKKHQAAGGTRDTFEPGFRSNDNFNYFWNRRPAATASSKAGEIESRSRPLR